MNISQPKLRSEKFDDDDDVDDNNNINFQAARNVSFALFWQFYATKYDNRKGYEK